MKVCSKCGVEKELSEFSKGKKDGLACQCKACDKKYYEENKAVANERMKKYQQANKAVISKRKKKHYQANKEVVNERQKKYRKENKEIVRERDKRLYEANKEVISKRKKKHYQENKEAIGEKQKKYYEENKEVICERQKKYRKENKEIVREQKKKYDKENREFLNDKIKKYREKNREVLVEKQKKLYEENKEVICEKRKKYYEENKEIVRERDKIKKKQKAKYKTYSDRLGIYDEIREDKDGCVEVKCTYCGAWTYPTVQQVQNRIQACESPNRTGDMRIYCSDECKNKCPIFGQVSYLKTHKRKSNRPQVDKWVIEETLQRDNYECQRCGRTEACDISLEVHHILGATQYPEYANDIDNLITLCEDCHDETHQQDGCTTSDLQQTECEFEMA